ncbi:hypothetical protein JGB17_23825 [Salmonella enterica subsp. enterica serovar Derby]|uniref:hypothetical protein n=1 Tax=Klebsiella pneumoniae TaxID=573 RepID=UPI001331125F|nr:hypothetical protein [Klebsiella pneumoniae]MBJ2942869.1 hypothetical protein [Salmonella enterica subsp. enterica serovar Derby]MBJ2965985.1 hypothetical protein [Salmonella enterica subsp. enterica serovar Kentucky]MBJ3300267.1 hypothetical protein [Salmonella enterica subsp. enterica serovar Corvallis]MBJ3372281.1 hypothetical protein [Salmonella enterica subsp. enterica serovar Typhimurium]MBJ3589257.1 hypothetical protein [Salmonella enterica subsp. enterica serovar London]MBJ3731605.
MSQKKVQKEEEKPTAGPLRKHRSRTEKIDDLKKQISELRKAEREERQRARDEKLIILAKAVYEKAGKPKDIEALIDFVKSEDFKIEYK